jgi:aryl-alcohol dehydrogenase-like predicted oxidoreductase
LLACATSLGPTSPFTRSAWARTSSAGRPTSRSPSPCSTPIGPPAATSSTPPTAIRSGCPATTAEESLRRLQTDRIDLLYTHRDDEVTPPEETLAELDALVREGKVRHVAAFNVSPERLEAAMRASEREGLVRYVALQPHYNLVERGYEDGLAEVCRRHDLGCLPYFALAKGFLTGKYRPGADEVRSERAQGAGAYLDERGERVLAALDAAAAAHDVPVAAVSLAWLAAQPTVVSPIASARTPAQLAELMAMADVELSADELRALDDASA